MKVNNLGCLPLLMNLALLCASNPAASESGCDEVFPKSKQVTISEIKSSPDVTLRSFKKLVFKNANRVPKQLIKSRPDIVKRIFNGNWGKIDKVEVDWNGRNFPMNSTTRSRAKKPIVLYRGLPEPPNEIDLMYLDQGTFDPVSLHHQTGTFMTTDKSYAIESYAGDLIIIKYIFPPQLVYGGRLATEFLVNNDESFRRRAKQSEINKLLVRHGSEDPDEAQKLWNLTHVIDQTPFISYIEFLPTGKKYSVEEFMKAFHYWSPPKERRSLYLDEFKEVEEIWKLNGDKNKNRMSSDEVVYSPAEMIGKARNSLPIRRLYRPTFGTSVSRFVFALVW